MKVAQLASFHFNILIRSEVQMCWACQTAAAAEKMPSWCSNYGISLPRFSLEAHSSNCAFLLLEVGGELCGSFPYAAYKYTHPHKQPTTPFPYSCRVFFSQALIEFSLMPSHQSKGIVSFVREAFAATQTYAPHTHTCTCTHACTQAHTHTQYVKYEWICDLYFASLCPAQEFWPYRA